MALIEIDGYCKNEDILNNSETPRAYIGSYFKITKLKNKFLLNTSEMKKVIKLREYDYLVNTDRDLGLYLIIIVKDEKKEYFCIIYCEPAFSRFAIKNASVVEEPRFLFPDKKVHIGNSFRYSIARDFL